MKSKNMEYLKKSFPCKFAMLLYRDFLNLEEEPDYEKEGKEIVFEKSFTDDEVLIEVDSWGYVAISDAVGEQPGRAFLSPDEFFEICLWFLGIQQKHLDFLLDAKEILNEMKEELRSTSKKRSADGYCECGCGKEIEQNKYGRTRKFYSKTCQKRVIRAREKIVDFEKNLSLADIKNLVQIAKQKKEEGGNNDEEGRA